MNKKFKKTTLIVIFLFLTLLIFHSCFYNREASRLKWVFKSGSWSQTFMKYNYTSVPLVLDDLCIWAGGYSWSPKDVNVFGIDLKTGKEKWRFKTRDAVSRVIADGQLIYFGDGESIFCLEPHSGKKLWEIKGRPFPVLYQNNLLLSQPIDPKRDKWVAVNKESGQMIWEYPYSSNIKCLLLLNNNVYFISEHSSICSMDLTNKKVDKIFDVPDAGTFINGAFRTISNNIIYFETTSDHNFYFHALDLKTREEKWRLPMKSSSIQPAVISEGVVYVGDTRFLYAIDEKTGQKIWQSKIDSLEAPPIVVGKTLYAVGVRKLYALNARTGAKKWHFKIKGWGKGIASDQKRKILLVSDDKLTLYALDISDNF